MGYAKTRQVAYAALSTSAPRVRAERQKTMKKFDKQVVVVTGGGSGIGKATAQKFYKEGASVVLVGRTESKLQKVARELDAARVLVHPCDVSKRDEVEAMIKATIKRFGRLDHLINNAGIAQGGPTLDAENEEWHNVFRINVDGVFFCARAALPHLLERRGTIVNVSSVSGIGGDWNMSFYNAAKGAVTNFTRSLAMEFGGRGVRVNAVCPSLTWSEMTSQMKDNEALMAKFKQRIPMGRAAEPEEVADVIAFLASHEARFVNGVNLPVDGGVSASNGQPALF